MNRQTRILVVVLMLVLCLAFPALAQKPGVFAFSADMSMTSKTNSSTGKMFFSGQKTRMEISAQGHQSIMITDNDRKVVDVLMPEQHMYMEMSTEQQQTAARGPMAQQKGSADMHSYDPANPCASSAGATCQKLGSETVNGRSCDKWQFAKGGKTQTLWLDQKLHFPIRMISDDGSTFELSNLKEGAPDASLFEVPAGYQKFDMGGMMNMRR